VVKERDFDEHIRRSASAVSTYARSLTSDVGLAEDGVQETFLRAWKYLDSFTGSGSFEGWLIRICRNCIVDLAAKNRQTDPLTQLQIDTIAAPVSASSPLEVQDLIDRLPLPQREVLVLVGVLGYDYEFTAELLGVPVGTVRSRLNRAREALAQMMREANTEAQTA
jgi:RNA polymerase sigma-70 factor, ECF subfamily